MSDKYSLEISNEAFEDLTDIQQYTFEKFGESQLSKYEGLLNDSLIQIQKQPFIGHPRSDMPKNYLSWAVGVHLLIYRIEANTIYLVRVLHKKMDFRFQFED